MSIFFFIFIFIFIFIYFYFFLFFLFFIFIFLFFLLLQLLLPPGVCGWEAKQEEEEKGWRESFSINLPFIFNLLSRTAETNYLVGGWLVELLETRRTNAH